MANHILTNLPEIQTSSIRTYLVEDQPLLRESLGAMLALDSEIELVGIAEYAEQAVREINIIDLDVVLMNIKLPGMNGIEAIRVLKADKPHLAVVVLTSYDDEYLTEAIVAGASGYMLKSCTRQQLVDAIRMARRGQMAVDMTLGGRLARELVEVREANKSAPLTSRQLEILKLVANGGQYDEIAKSLFISKSTVSREIRDIINNLGVNNVTQAIHESNKRHLI